MLSEKTGLPSAVFVFGPLAIMLLAIFFGIGASLFTKVIGVVYPIFRSIQAIDSPDKNDDIQWLTYWSVYALTLIVDDIFPFLSTVVPFYYFFKVCFLISLLNPAINGASQIYLLAIKPVYTKYESQIICAMNLVQ